MINTRFFCIEQISTGLLFPATGRGSSHVATNDTLDERGSYPRHVFGKGSPRLFRQQHHADRCLKEWLVGPQSADHEYDPETGGYEFCGVKVNKNVKRNPADFRVVGVGIVSEAVLNRHVHDCLQQVEHG